MKTARELVANLPGAYADAWASMERQTSQEVAMHIVEIVAQRARLDMPASALARKRWSALTKEQRREATSAATAASPRTKKRKNEPAKP